MRPRQLPGRQLGREILPQQRFDIGRGLQQQIAREFHNRAAMLGRQRNATECRVAWSDRGIFRNPCQKSR